MTPSMGSSSEIYLYPFILRSPGSLRFCRKKSKQSIPRKRENNLQCTSGVSLALSTSHKCLRRLVGKVTLDIISLTAFGYKTDCLHDPHNELAQAYEVLVGMQSGRFPAIFFVRLFNAIDRVQHAQTSCIHEHPLRIQTINVGLW